MLNIFPYFIGKFNNLNTSQNFRKFEIKREVNEYEGQIKFVHKVNASAGSGVCLSFDFLKIPSHSKGLR